MKLVAFAGSNSSTSINRELVRFALTLLPDFEVNLLDLNDFEMPIFSVDREQEGYPRQVNAFLKAMSEADGIIYSMAENNRSYSVAFKNVFDWASRITNDIFAQKPMLLMSTSTGKFGGSRVMDAAKKLFPTFGADVVETFSLPMFNDNFVVGKGITDETLRDELVGKVAVFDAKVKALLQK